MEVVIQALLVTENIQSGGWMDVHSEQLMVVQLNWPITN